MALHSRADILRWTLLGALGVSMTFSCSGSVETSEAGKSGDGDNPSGDGDGGGDGDIRGDGDVGGDGDTVGDGDGAGGSGDGDGAGGSGDGDGVGGSGDGDGAGGSSGGGTFAACTNPVDLGGGFFSCDEGYTHRPTTAECPSSVPRDEQIGNPTACSLEQGCCQMDADCTGTNEFCIYTVEQMATSWCATGCKTDADCGEGTVCQCGDPMGRCVSADCRTDDDCPGDARCASFATNDGCGPWTRFTCQTAEDECASNLDCPAGEECDGSGGVRQCVVQESSCAVGRPFTVAEEIRVAPLLERLDWVEQVQPDLSGVSPEERAELGAAWETIGQMEHASIAAFARFALQLLSLGAPAELVERTNQALADETRHARACFALASAYRGRSVGPGRLEIGGALGDESWEGILATTIFEGCCGEAAAALEASEAAAQCQDEAVRAILLQIAEDESRHAELAFRFVGWALEQRPDLKNFARAEFARVLGEVPDTTSAEPEERERYGVFGEARRRAIRRQALREVVTPCAQALLSVPPAPRGRRRVQAPSHFA